MASINKAIDSNDINNQGSAVLGVNRGSGASDIIVKASTTTPSEFKWTDGINPILANIQTKYDEKFDDYGLRRKTIEIGDWNMNTTASSTVTHGLSSTQWKNLRSVEVAVRNDDDDVYYTDSTDTSADADAGIEIDKIDATNVTLKRAALGTFDSSDFEKTSYNRGWVTIWYA